MGDHPLKEKRLRLDSPSSSPRTFPGAFSLLMSFALRSLPRLRNAFGARQQAIPSSRRLFSSLSNPKPAFKEHSKENPFRSSLPLFSSSSTLRFLPYGAAIVGGGLAAALYMKKHAFCDERIDEEGDVKPGLEIPGLPEYTKEDIAKHKDLESGIWVSYKNGVYDITEFVESHPGGTAKIMLAAGSSIDPFWLMYQQHNHVNVHEILEEYRIGNLARTDQAGDVIDANDPYANEPVRHPALIVRSMKPFNAEPPLSILVDSFITPVEFFFVRNHLPVPLVDPKKYVLEVTGEGVEPVTFTLDDLKTKFQKHSVISTIQCAGNRRNEMSTVKKVRGGEWESGAISNAEWTGVRLRDVLDSTGWSPETREDWAHVQFEGLDQDIETPYGSSIPLTKAVDPLGDVILAWEMNGQELPRDHGFPLRVVVPGIVGARNVKWLKKIILSHEESRSQFQRNDYKGFSPNVDWHNVDWKSAPAIQELPVQSSICVPSDGAKLPPGEEEVTVKGFAWSGGGRGIVRVDVSLDGGNEWHTADLQKPDQPYNRVWAWTLWEANIPIPKDHKGSLDITCKAVDSSYNVQPERIDPIWNLRGVLCNSWHHVKVELPK